MQRRSATLSESVLGCALAGALSLGPVQAQELPTDRQLQMVFGALCNRLGLMEYCMDAGLAKAVDVANTRRSVVATIAGMTVTPAAVAQQATGRRGYIVGPQIIGLMDSSDPVRPEEVPEGQVMSLADHARAQKSTERTLCRQMADQASAAIEAASSAASDP